MKLTEIAKLFIFVRELNDRQNDGPWVEAILRVVSQKKGAPWCMAYASVVLALRFGGNSPLPMTASCHEAYSYGVAHGMRVDTPQAGDLFFVLTDEGHAHHVGICTGPAVNGVFPTIEGNTNPAGGREGYGVFERERAVGPHIAFIRVIGA